MFLKLVGIMRPVGTLVTLVLGGLSVLLDEMQLEGGVGFEALPTFRAEKRPLDPLGQEARLLPDRALPDHLQMMPMVAFPEVVFEEPLVALFESDHVLAARTPRFDPAPSDGVSLDHVHGEVPGVLGPRLAEVTPQLHAEAVLAGPVRGQGAGRCEFLPAE